MYFGWYVLVGIGLVQIANTAAGSLNFSMFVVTPIQKMKTGGFQIRDLGYYLMY